MICPFCHVEILPLSTGMAYCPRCNLGRPLAAWREAQPTTLAQRLALAAFADSIHVGEHLATHGIHRSTPREQETVRCLDLLYLMRAIARFCEEPFDYARWRRILARLRELPEVPLP